MPHNIYRISHLKPVMMFADDYIEWDVPAFVDFHRNLQWIKILSDGRLLYD
jgi:hypothetical protein